jgi:hypothetical protein
MTRTLERGSGGRCTFGGGGWQSVKQGRTVGGVRYGVTGAWAGPGRRKENGPA